MLGAPALAVPPPAPAWLAGAPADGKGIDSSGAPAAPASASLGSENEEAVKEGPQALSRELDSIVVISGNDNCLKAVFANLSIDV